MDSWKKNMEDDINDFRVELTEVKGSMSRMESMLTEVMQQMQRLSKSSSDNSSNYTNASESEVVSEPRSWTKKIELPVFEGLDPVSWIARAEKFFEVHRVQEEEKIQLAFISMEGEAVHWFRFIRRRTPTLSWNSLIPLLLQRFDEGCRGNVYERLKTPSDQYH